MKTNPVLDLLQRVAAGDATPADAFQRLAWLPVEELGDESAAPGVFARLDHHRAMRVGFPEVVFCPGKSVVQVIDICRRLERRERRFLATRADDAARQALAEAFPAAESNPIARTVWLNAPGSGPDERRSTILIATGGTADLPVAEEAAVTALALGNPIERLYDVGVAGLHRLLSSSEALERAGVVIAVAGMEGALPSVIGGLVAKPVIAVPTSTGYGASFGGIAALLAMLNSCASGVTVVNIDNGFGAACAANRINLATVLPR
ncbi:MAG: nickel pincer cofactor biosynthesis protein LarB [Gemmatimonadetes bacterium]|nr:nickel pincer cofactor biosynthesis protein LarB [Gemmatimonadota bacterium]